MTIDEVRARGLLAQIDALLLLLDTELDHLAHGRRITVTNARLYSVAIGLRLRLARRVDERTIVERTVRLEARWRALAPAIDQYCLLLSSGEL
jgi:hypothetical protein